jgi:hypothetical protein
MLCHFVLGGRALLVAVAPLLMVISVRLATAGPSLPLLQPVRRTVWVYRRHTGRRSLHLSQEVAAVREGEGGIDLLPIWPG